jgi:hypothetical protein
MINFLVVFVDLTNEGRAAEKAEMIKRKPVIGRPYMNINY